MPKHQPLNERLESALYKGASFQEVEGSSDRFSSNFTPNNLKTVVISPMGALFVTHLSIGNQPYRIRQVSFPKTNETIEDLNHGKELLSFANGHRVFSAIEEFIFIVRLGDIPVSLPKRQLLIVKEKLINPLKRLRDIVVIPQWGGTLESFKETFQSALTDDTTAFGNLPTIKNQKAVSVIPLHQNWATVMPLRPKYYQLDQSTGQLAKHFHTIKDEMALGDRLGETLHDIDDLSQLYVAITAHRQHGLSWDNQTIPSQTVRHQLQKQFSQPLGEISWLIDESERSKLPERQQKQIQTINERLKKVTATHQSLTVQDSERLRQQLLKQLVHRISQDYKKDNSRLGEALSSYFNRVIRLEKYQDVKQAISQPTRPIGNGFLPHMAALLTGHFEPLANDPVATIGGEDRETIQTFLAEHEDFRRSHQLATVQSLAFIEKGVSLQGELTEGTLLILHDALVKRYDLDRGLYLRSLNYQQGNTIHPLGFEPSKVGHQVAEMMREISPQTIADDDESTAKISSEETSNHQTEATSGLSKASLALLDAIDTPPTLEDDDSPSTDLSDEALEQLREARWEKERALDKDDEEKADKRSENDYGIRQYAYWIDKLENLYDEEPLDSVPRQCEGAVRDFILNARFLLVQEDRLDSDVQKQLITMQNEYMAAMTPPLIRAELAWSHVKFDRSQSYYVLNSLGTTFTNGFEYFFNLQGKMLPPEKTYQYPKTLWYLMKG